MSSSPTALQDLKLPAKLNELALAFAKMPNPKMRYRQLLFFAQKCPPMESQYMVEENRVPGCLSTVHVHVLPFRDDEGIVRVNFQGDSDGQLTKGLVHLLVKGLSGCTPSEIGEVDPEFVKATGLAESLTPGRNNGFLNMLKTMKKKARDVATEFEGSGSSTASVSPEES
uniref:Fe-S metabolism associated domain-containing protein n=1 Tax=Chromera velia CCMP2878 TaxID=1169474 RepID=A0A0G4GGP0_9ALVE|eukprot:Cvel_21762.t1-p1 / transcript=Cvel_21762.t1 / gene=Cvel_21762 / organism=Chromera_velia_CCMP2878 / gene_product=SufE-like protein, chloroplastic, putative / transcript_product=SufE-like protein, chloroplastic, putative / location=Cvel_scaffold2069:16699-20045(-) / protein_length=169 / sequence_SO=supercontig / SO=protein_coding / is_pseudo=false